MTNEDVLGSKVLVRIPISYGNDAAIRNWDFDITPSSLETAMTEGYTPVPRFFKDFEECEYYWKHMMASDPMLKYTRQFNEILPFSLNQDLDMWLLTDAKMKAADNGYVLMFFVPIGIFNEYKDYFDNAAVYIAGIVKENSPATEKECRKIELVKLCALNIIGNAINK